MFNNRGPSKCMCSELVKASWQDTFGRKRETVVNLEEVWTNGALLQLESPVRPDTPIEMSVKGINFSGTVKKCSADFIGFQVEMCFVDGQEWSRDLCEPDHFFDPQSLLPNPDIKAKNNRLLEDCAKSLSLPRA
jgi:hypothetical protein